MIPYCFFCAKIICMSNFCLRKINEYDVYKELENINFDKSYLKYAVDKYKYVLIKIYSLTLIQANILKQTALSVGTDCAVNRGVLTSEVEFSDCILGGSFAQIKQIAEKLKFQQFSMSNLAQQIEQLLETSYSETKIVGILNLTKNSFSDGGDYYHYEDAVRHLNSMVEDGADMIDIGAESTKPYSEPVSDNKQIEKIKPILEYINDKNIKIPVSVDTRSSKVAKMAIEYGVSVINDVSGMDYDEKMLNVVIDSGVKIVVQHSQGTPENMQNNPKYENIVDDIYLNFCRKLQCGIKKENIIIDVGIGFGKTRKQNFELIRRIEEFKSLGCELMLGVSRKSLLGMSNASNEEKDIFTVAINALAINNKVDYIRVHNVKLHKKLISLMKEFY